MIISTIQSALEHCLSSEPRSGAMGLKGADQVQFAADNTATARGRFTEAKHDAKLVSIALPGARGRARVNRGACSRWMARGMLLT